MQVKAVYRAKEIDPSTQERFVIHVVTYNGVY